MLALDRGRAVGFGAFMPGLEGVLDGPPIARLAHVWAVFAAPSHWGRGVAPAVLDALVAEMRRRGYAEARLFTPALQARARAFYAREGWREVSGPDWVESLGLDTVELRRPL